MDLYIYVCSGAVEGLNRSWLSSSQPQKCLDHERIYSTPKLLLLDWSPLINIKHMPSESFNPLLHHRRYYSFGRGWRGQITTFVWITWNLDVNHQCGNILCRLTGSSVLCSDSSIRKVKNSLKSVAFAVSKVWLFGSTASNY
jgi:hypothetical protein